ncbi:MAG: S8 family peptidase [Thermaceae bacterium]|nr:S8 family peptidase [Thermaceae bacterium]
MKHWRIWATGLLALISACGGGTGGGGSSGSIQGTVKLAFGSPASLPDLAAFSNSLTPPSGEFVPGEVIVRFKPSVSLQSVQTLQVAGISLQRMSGLGLTDTALYRTTTSTSDTLALVEVLRQRADVLYAQPNYLMQALATPNDPAFPIQWDFAAMKLPTAWDIEKGTSSPVTVAVVDTGMLSQHPDLAGKTLPGYDFITDPRQANDGDGRDPNPEDPGDNPGKQSSYHGSHVAGTIAATTNNAVGVAGISWGAKILPVRVLGVGGGASSDIIAGILWAAGIHVDGVPDNPNPAQVINLSLGGKYTCDQAPAYQDAFNQVAAKGAIVAVAAGNSSDDASLYSPASCSGVITVGASETRNFRAYYSNYGPRIDVIAPGGDTSVGTINKVCGTNGDQFCPDGILSTIKNDASGQYIYAFYQGTSMASPHVAGLLALMKSKNPSLTAAAALDILKRTAHPLTTEACTGKPSAALDKVAPNFPNLAASDCGAGLVDATAALQAVGGGGGGTPTPDLSLSLNPNSLTLSPGGNSSINLSITPTGGFSNPVNLSLVGAPSGVSGSFTPNPASSNSVLSLSVSTSTAPGTYALTIAGSSGGLNRTANLSLLVQAPTGTGSKPSLKGAILGACYAIIVAGRVDCDSQKSVAIQLGGLAGNNSGYQLEGLAAGKYYILGWKDVNGNNQIDNGDYLGAYVVNGNLAFAKPGDTSINFQLDVIQSTSAAAAQARLLWPKIQQLRH